MLEREKAPCAPEPGLHLVDAEQRSVRTAERLGALQVAGRREEEPVADDRLDDEQRHVARAQLLLERVEVVPGDPREARHERCEAVRECGVAGGR